jgi:hypothetical protein
LEVRVEHENFVRNQRVEAEETEVVPPPGRSEEASDSSGTVEQSIAYCKIHPAIGVARVGNSPDEYFVGPEVPGVFDPPSGGYKDAGDLNKGIPPRVKRQAARFRVFGYNRDDKVVGEITAEEAEITWTVHLANKKAEWDRFRGRAGEELPIGERRKPPDLRNPDIRDVKPEEHKKKRQALIIDAGPLDLRGPGKAAKFPTERFVNPRAKGFKPAGDYNPVDKSEGIYLGTFFDVPVPLGEIRTDSAGRLLVLGGFGESGTSEPERRVTHYANNDRWYDDVSDGPVTAKVRLRNGGEIPEVRPSWVIVGPPDFAPGVPNIVTMFDVVYETAINKGYLKPPDPPSFTEHVYPILLRSCLNIWVHEEAATRPQGHGSHANRAGDFFEYWDQLKSDLPENREARRQVFGVLRDPNATGETAKAQANGKFMPPLSGDGGDVADGEPGTWLTLTKTQYEVMRRWAEGDFEADWPDSLSPGFLPTPSDDDISPEGLDRAALEACVGGGFYPGIEGGWMFRNPDYYSEPFRLDHSHLRPGDATKRMAVPWQADFYECHTHWWPAQRPDAVLTSKGYKLIREIDRQIANLEDVGDPNDPDNPKRLTEEDKDLQDLLKKDRDKLAKQRAPWTRIMNTQASPPLNLPDGKNQMVRKWYRLGFLSDQEKDGEPIVLEGRPAFVETETGKYEGLSMARYFHYLANIGEHPDFLPMARELALDFFARANYAADPNYSRFDYTPEAFDRRMDKIYDDLVAGMHDPYWLDEPVRFSREAAIEHLRQKAPMNLVDGAWLQNILSTGPADDVKSTLFAIWADEAGNGETELNHCNVYDSLLRSVNVDLPDIISEEFYKLDLLPSAWSNPVFQLSVGLFPQEFFPELLGMTLYLEWEATPTLTPIVKSLEERKIDPHFYRLHVAIDNVASGHGAMAKRAIKLYLDKIQEQGGDRAVQHHWTRIWNGYVTWATEGTFASDLREYLKQFDGKQKEPKEKLRYAQERMEAMVRRKAPYARKSHGKIGLGAKPLNELFDEPAELMDALLNSRWIDRDNPRESLLFAEMLPKGRMYEVFTPEDQDIILDWLEALRTSGPVAPPDPGQKMRALIESRRHDGTREEKHGDYELPDPEVPGGKKTVQALFEKPEALMKALANSEYINREKPEESEFLTEVLEKLMSRFRTDLTDRERETMTDWVKKGCPMPIEPPSLDRGPAQNAAVTMDAVAVGDAAAVTDDAETVETTSVEDTAAVADESRTRFAKRRLMIGAGSVH